MDTLIAGFLDHGILGLVIVGLLLAMLRIYNRNEALQTQKDELQEKRVAETRALSQVVEQTTAAMNALTDVVKDRSK